VGPSTSLFKANSWTKDAPSKHPDDSNMFMSGSLILKISYAGIIIDLMVI